MYRVATLTRDNGIKFIEYEGNAVMTLDEAYHAVRKFGSRYFIIGTEQYDRLKALLTG